MCCTLTGCQSWPISPNQLISPWKTRSSREPTRVYVTDCRVLVFHPLSDSLPSLPPSASLVIYLFSCKPTEGREEKGLLGFKKWWGWTSVAALEQQQLRQVIPITAHGEGVINGLYQKVNAKSIHNLI